MFLLLTISANPFIGENIEVFTVIGLLFIFIAYSFTLKISLKDEIIPFLIILFFISFEFIHKLIFGLNNNYTIIRILGYYFLAYFAVKTLKTKFISVYISLIYFFAIISLIFYVLSLTPIINAFIYKFADLTFPLALRAGGYHTPTLIIFTFSPEYFNGSDILLRNAGFTWEAGTFGIFLNLALFFYISSTRNISLKVLFSNAKGIVMLIALLLTFSTTAYIVFGMYLLYFAFKEKGIKKYIILVFVVLLMFFSFVSINFLQNKITSQIETAHKSQNRFGAALLDWNDIIKRPLFGWSRDEKVLFGIKAHTYATHRPNGLTNQIRSYGFIYIFFYFLIMYLSFKKYFSRINKKNANILSLLVLLIIILSSFSELILDKIIFKSFLFLVIAYKIYPIKKLSFTTFGRNKIFNRH